MEDRPQIAPKEFIRKWMEHKKVFVGEAKEAPDDASFILYGKSGIGIPFVVIQPSAWETSVIVLSDIRVADEHISLLKSMRSKDRKRFLGDLTKEIVFAPALYAFDSEFNKTGILSGIQFSKEICYDGLTEDRLSECMHDVVRCVAYVTQRFKEEFAEPEGE